MENSTTPPSPLLTAKPRLAVVVFSKDRPFQLLSCLGSLLRSARGVVLDIFVLFKASSPAFADSYRVLRGLFGTSADLKSANAGCHARGLVGDAATAQVAEFNLHWEEETSSTDKNDEVARTELEDTCERRSLGDLLDKVVLRAETLGSHGLLFTVDDALWFGNFDAAAALNLLQAQTDVYSVHAKLCPRIEYAHPNDKFMRLPRFRSAPDVPMDGIEASTGLLVFERGQGEFDWNYPWELSASIYRLTDVREMLALIVQNFGKEGVDHPNRLEGYGVRLIKQDKAPSAARAKLCACLENPVVAVVTINRVQSIFDNPVYGREGGTASHEESPEALDSLFREALRSGVAGLPEEAKGLAQRMGLTVDWLAEYCRSSCTSAESSWVEGDVLSQLPPRPLINVDRYRGTYFDSVHVPLLDVLPLSSPPSLPNPVVSWLMPIFNAPEEWLEAAWASIVGQAGMGPGSWELVVVDDNSDSPETLRVLSQWETLPEIRVVRSATRQGVAGALNAGWAHCRGEFVARLDADDVAHRERLRRQLGYFEAHPSLGVLGGAFRTFRDSAELESPAKIARATRLYRMPCHPVIARWRMVFGCSLAHPTVTFKKALLPPSGPYPENEEAEDHCCWLGLPRSVQYANLADVVGFLRRHPGSRSASAAEAIRRSSFGGVRRFIAEHCATSFEPSHSSCQGDQRTSSESDAAATELSDADIRVLWGAGAASSSEQAQRVSKVLDMLEKHFFQLISAAEDEEHTKSPIGFVADFVKPRRAALKEYIGSSCSKLRGSVAVQSLASGDLASGTEMMKLWLNGGGAGLKSLGALIGAGFPQQS